MLKKPSKLSGLYLITPNQNDTADLQSHVEAALKAGARILQYRNKTADRNLQLQQAILLRALCAPYDALFIINDDIHLAAQCGAGGVHLGQSDASIGLARDLLGEKTIIGRTCHGDISLAEKAVIDGADYVSLGCFFPSQTKPHAIRADLSILKKAKACVELPIVAIGGITLNNAPKVLAEGADMIAMCAEIFASKDTFGMIQDFQSLLGAPHV